MTTDDDDNDNNNNLRSMFLLKVFSFLLPFDIKKRTYTV